MMAVKLYFCVFEATVVNFCKVCKLKLNIDCRVPNVFNFDIFLFNVIDGDIKIKLQLVDDNLLSLDLPLLIYLFLVLEVCLSKIYRNNA